jgi:hypothetical protein
MLTRGDRLGGYVIDDLLGVGGMGVVYRATQSSLGRPVALKVMSPQLLRDTESRERFRREGRAAAALDHPNVITVYEAEEADGTPFIAMKLVTGTTLDELVGRPELTAGRTLSLLRPVADALDFAHDRGLVHRDVKPSNILIARNDHPYLADFGITKTLESQGITGTGRGLGSLAYAPPEQIRGQGVTGKADIYALTAVVVECLTGRPPFVRDDDAALIHAHLNDAPPRVSEAAPEIGTAVDDVVARGMAKDPAARFESANDLVCELASALHANGRAPAASVPESPRPPAPATVTASPVEAPTPAPPSPETVTTAPRSDTGSGRRRVPLGPTAAALGLAALGLGGGLLAGRGEVSRQAERAGVVRLSHGGGWQHAAPAPEAIAGLQLREPVVLRRGEAVLAAGILADPARGANPLPRGLELRVPGRAAARRVRLGSAQALAYDATAARPRARLRVYIVPTNRGYATVACQSPVAQGAASGARCADVAATVRLSGARALPLTPVASYGTDVSTALARLDVQRGAAAPALRSDSLSRRAAAARRLAAAHRAAGASMSKLSPVPQDAAADASLERSLGGLARSFTRLAAAAQAGDADAYDAARRNVTAGEGVLRAALASLRANGYRTRR